MFVKGAIAVELMTDASADAGGESGHTALWPILVLDGARFAGWFWKDQGAGIATTFVLEAGGFAGEGEFEGHSESGP